MSTNKVSSRSIDIDLFVAGQLTFSSPTIVDGEIKLVDWERKITIEDVERKLLPFNVYPIDLLDAKQHDIVVALEELEGEHYSCRLYAFRSDGYHLQRQQHAKHVAKVIVDAISSAEVQCGETPHYVSVNWE